MADPGDDQVAALLRSRFGDLADEMRILAASNRPLHASASAFRFAWDPDHAGVAATAVAQELDLAIEAMTADGELHLTGYDPSGGDGEPDPVGPVGHSDEADLAAALANPATMAAREKAEQGCRALAQGWFEEAEQLFGAGARLDPTEPVLRFGAGLAAWRQRSARAADHFNLAARYLAPTDPAGSAWVAILAAAVHERLGDPARARALLVEAADRLPLPCPAIALHLARLEPERRSWGETALSVDPLLEVDLVALGLEPDREVSTEHRFRIEWDINQLEGAISEVRRLDGGRSWLDAGNPRLFGRDSDRLLVARGELALAAQVASCRAAVDGALAALAERTADRRAREEVWQREADEAGADLRHHTVAPVFVTCCALAVAGMVVALAGRLAIRAAPSAGMLIALVAHLVMIGLLGASIWLFATTWWPHRRYRSARLANQELPRLRFEAGLLREEEFDLRRRIGRAAHDVDQRLAGLGERRAAIVPRRPVLLDLPALVDDPAPVGTTALGDQRAGASVS